jgi:hypothetical protein
LDQIGSGALEGDGVTDADAVMDDDTESEEEMEMLGDSDDETPTI